MTMRDTRIPSPRALLWLSAFLLAVLALMGLLDAAGIDWRSLFD